MAISLSNLPWYGQIGAFVVVCGTAVWGFHNFYANAVLAELETSRARVVTLRTDIDRGVNTARQLPQFRAQVLDLERRLDELKAILPDQKDAQEILRRLDTLAQQSNLRVISFTPKASTKKQLHEEWPIEMQVLGTYHDLGHYFDRIGRFPRIINVGDVQINGFERPTGPTIAAKYTATTFVLLEQPAAGRTGGPGTPAAGTPPTGAVR
jgi:type IV pilus assembly protein PilO